ncbi:MAG: DUF2076 domain-containing protein [Hyphomicrobiaceae bacterium]|nr:DUF2076 domain-containing protein [Hyphomicrobiaceae bacterium]
MDANDRKLISDMFKRMQNVQSVQVDKEAEEFIHNCMRQNPTSPYLLVQSVLVQEQALKKADERIQILEREVAQRSEKHTSNKKSFFGRGGVPAFGAKNRNVSSVPQSGSTPWQPATQQFERQDGRRQTSGGSGFMAQAMTTAAGVAGGMLLASGISSLISGASSPATAATPSEANEPDVTDNATEQIGTDNSFENTEAPEQDVALQDATNDEGSSFADWGGGDDMWGGDSDFEI